MPSLAHQSLLLWSTRRMIADGFDLTGFDGQVDQAGSLNRLPRPFQLHGVRPDACGVHLEAAVIGFAEAKTEYIVSNDADSQLVPNYLETVEQAFLKYPEAAAIFGPVYLMDGPGWLKWLSRYGFTLFLHISILLGKPNLNGQNFACRRKNYNEVGGFDLSARTAEDVVLGQRLKKSGSIKFVPELIVYTSARRITGMGAGKFLLHHTRNYLRILTGKSGIDNFKPYR